MNTRLYTGDEVENNDTYTLWTEEQVQSWVRKVEEKQKSPTYGYDFKELFTLEDE